MAKTRTDEVAAIAECMVQLRLIGLPLSSIPRPAPAGLPHDSQVGRMFIQTKGSETLQENGSFVFNISRSQDDVSYTPYEIDFVAAYILPINKCFVLPQAVIGDMKCLRIYPFRDSKYAIYDEAWMQVIERDRELNGGTGRWMGISLNTTQAQPLLSSTNPGTLFPLLDSSQPHDGSMSVN